MAKHHVAVPGSNAPKIKRHFEYRKIFRTPRMLAYFIIWTLFFLINATLLGLISQQIHKHGGQNRFDWPTQEYGNTMGLILFTSIFGLLISTFHWWFGLGIQAVLFFALAIFNGTGAGVLEATPFGHGMQCRRQDAAAAAKLPPAYRPYISDCSRVTAIEGLSWALFALSVFGLFFTIFDKFEFHSRRGVIYDIELPATTDEEKGTLHRNSSATAV